MKAGGGSDTEGMRCTVTTSDLAAALSSAQRATPARPSMMAYSAVSLVAKGTELVLTGSDGELTVSSRAVANVIEAGSSLVQPRPLSAWLTTVDAESLELTDDGSGDLIISAGGAHPYRFRTLSTSFPATPRLAGAPKPVELTGLSEAIASVSKSVDRDNRIVQLVSSDSALRINATDTYRLTQAVIDGAGFGDFTGLVPLSLLEQLSEDVESVVVDTSGRVLELRSPSTTWTTRLAASAFPAVESVLINVPANSVTLPVSATRRSLARLRSVVDQEPLHCTFSRREAAISVPGSPLGSGSESIPLEGGPETPFEFGVNLTYLDEALGVRSAEKVTVFYSASVAPLFFISSGKVSVTSVVMPVRL